MNILQKQGEGNDNANGDGSTDDDDYNTIQYQRYALKKS